MNFRQYRDYVLSDLYRYCGVKSKREFWRAYFLIPGFKYTFWLRTARFLKGNLLLVPLYVVSRFLLNRLKYKFGIDIPYNTSIGTGLYIGHFGGIVVSDRAQIGNNCNINQGVTVGTTFGGRYPGTPKIGDYVYMGPGSFIIGGIEVGSNVAIGANTVVNKSVSDNGVVVGQAGELVSFQGAAQYVINTDY